MKTFMLLILSWLLFGCEAWSSPERPHPSQPSQPKKPSSATPTTGRRQAIGWIAAAAGVVATTTTATTTAIQPCLADPGKGMDVDDYLRTGLVAQPMGVSGQAGKSRPETGVVLRDGSEISRNSKSGDVSAEILLKAGSGSSSSDKVPVLTSFSSPWPLATGTVFDVECRDPSTGDGAFLAVTDTTGGKSIAALEDSFFVDQLVKPTGRFSFYGSPTDVKTKKSTIITNSGSGDEYRQMDLSFSTLSQSTQTEIPRRARVIATIPKGTQQAVMLVASASALRWKKGSEQTVASVTESFRAIPAPQTLLKIRAKERRGSSALE